MQNDYYLVERIIAKKKSGDSVKYLVKWVGFPLEQSTWEPIEHLENVKLLLEDFENSQKENLNLDYNPNKKKYKKENDEMSESDESISDDSDKDEKSEHSFSSNSNGLSEKSINKSNSRKRLKNNGRKMVLKSKPQRNDSENETDESKMTVDLEVDEPLKVIDSKMDTKKKIICFVEWKVRSDGMKPDNSYISTDLLKEKYPKFLIDYYESRIKFVK